MRVDPAQQRARDSDARRILEAELAKEEERLAALRKDYNNQASPSAAATSATSPATRSASPR